MYKFEGGVAMRLEEKGYIVKWNDRSNDIDIKGEGYSSFGLVDRIQERIEKRDGVKSYSDYKKHLGRDINIIDNCSIRLYFIDKECTLEDADLMVATQLDGKYFSDKDLTGYSEFTILGYEINKCEIGGHKLLDIIREHIGEYMIFVMEWN